MNEYYREVFIKVTGETPEKFWEGSSDTTPINEKIQEFVEEYWQNNKKEYIGHEWRNV